MHKTQKIIYGTISTENNILFYTREQAPRINVLGKSILQTKSSYPPYAKAWLNAEAFLIERRKKAAI